MNTHTRHPEHDSAARLFGQVQELANQSRAISEFNQRILQSIEEGILLLDEKGLITYTNPGLQRMLDYGGDALLKKDWLCMVDPSQHDKARREIASTLVGSKSKFELNLLRVDGQRLRVLVSATRQSNAEGLSEVLCVCVDIMERERREHLLRTLNAVAVAMGAASAPQEILSVAAQALSQAGVSCSVLLLSEDRQRLSVVVTTHADRLPGLTEQAAGLSSESYAVDVDASGAFLRVIGDRDTVLVRDVTESIEAILPPDMRARAPEIVQQFDIQEAILAPMLINGEAVGILAMGASGISESDRPVVTAFANQMTMAWHRATILQKLQRSLAELKQAQEQLVQAEKLAAIGQLVSGVAHELNNPLTAIGGLAELAELSAADAQTRRDLQRIRSQAQRAANIVRNLLVFARTRTPQRLAVDVNAALRQCVEAQADTLQAEGVRVQLRLAEGLPLVQADPFQLQQVFLNLLTNARQAMVEAHGRGNLVITTVAASQTNRRAADAPAVLPPGYVGLSMGHAAGRASDLQAASPWDSGLTLGDAPPTGVSVPFDWSPAEMGAEVDPPEWPGLTMGDAPPVESRLPLGGAPGAHAARPIAVVCIEFQDDGPGIRPEVMGKIFDPFFTTKPAGMGTGLGLSICYGIIQAHHGRITCHSQEGQGATFVVELPVDGQQEDAQDEV